MISVRSVIRKILQDDSYNFFPPVHRSLFTVY